MSEIKDIVIIGAGYAGVHAAKKLAKKYKKDESVRITLIDRNSYHTMLTELHEVAGARVEPTAVQFDLRRLFNRTKVNLVTDSVTHVDHDKKVVTTKNGSYAYDYLMLGMGSEPNDFGVPGVKDHGFTLWSWEDAMEIRSHIESIVEKAARVHDAAKRREMLTFAVAGSGFTGIEMVGELIEWRDRLAKDNKIDSKEIRLMVIEAAPTILNLLERKDADIAEKYMLKQGVEVLKSSQIVELKENAVVLKSGEEVPTQTLIWTAGIKSNTDAAEFGMESARAGRLVVNEYMEAKGLKNVYVVGDQAYFEEEGGNPTPQIVQAAEQTAICAAKSIIAEISGGEKTPYKGKYDGFMVSIGARYGVAHLAGKYHLKGWLAIFVKHMVNLVYFFGLRSGYYAFQYIQHEFFHVKDKRQIFRGTLTRYGNVLWALPLRIFLGGFWINQSLGKIYGHENWDKVGEGFENMVGFRGIFDGIGNMFDVLRGGIGADSWLLSNSVKMGSFDWLMDAASGATSAATSAATSGATGAEGATWAAPIIGQPPMWFQFFMRIAMPNADVAVFSQYVIVFVQLAIGLALIVGLFTWLCSFASAGLLVVLLFSAMLGWDSVWAIPVSIALMNGAGRSLGLDYYVVPWLQKTVGRWWYGKESSLYQDR